MVNIHFSTRNACFIYCRTTWKAVRDHKDWGKKYALELRKCKLKRFDMDVIQLICLDVWKFEYDMNHLSLTSFLLFHDVLKKRILYCYRGHDVIQILQALNGSSKYPRASSALSSILTRNALNPGDITALYKLYSTQDPPPVELIRLSQFMGK